MQAVLRLMTQWDPILFADLHVTDGAQFEHDISYSVAPHRPRDEFRGPGPSALGQGVGGGRRRSSSETT
jgi:hypothetical protein